jgi:hypothetical protein
LGSGRWFSNFLSSLQEVDTQLGGIDLEKLR